LCDVISVNSHLLL